ncbi:hypothetical protein ACIBQ2_25190 [Micromonospora sediminimaris]|uniref:Uncharacterized protein n=1 Tax=Micromonospora sediminimaris TaxID=547162 RepID=A0A9W5ULP0_9ACTN|nr:MULTISPECIES: hypothetical protein [Micromonospora]WFE43476.1 hypothetical protein O7624_03635 [Verrucosispora sp. WMMD1129]GIJ31507.1 hypothetical protein Vse01_06550 [Micromonospora sediminimaris]SFC38137.1 hypothetical protein SAMN05216284_104138 [Micromonospora sediminimaris]
MEQWPPADDAALGAELRAALGDAGEVPEEHLRAARAAFAWRTVGAQPTVAELVFDSACEPGAVATRSAGSTRNLSFRGGPIVVEIEIGGTGIVGQLSPVDGGRVSARTANGTYEETSVDAVGLFSLGLPPPGPVQLHARSGGFSVVTDWVCLR